MATLSIAFSDASKDRVIDAFAAHHKYQPLIPNPSYDPETDDPSEETAPNPVTKGQFMKQKVIAFVKESVKAEESRASMTAAKQALSPVPDVT